MTGEEGEGRACVDNPLSDGPPNKIKQPWRRRRGGEKSLSFSRLLCQVPWRRAAEGYWDGVPGCRVRVEDVEVGGEAGGVEEAVMKDWKQKQEWIERAVKGEAAGGRGIMTCDAAGLRSWVWYVFAPVAVMQCLVFWGGVWILFGGWIILIVAWAVWGGETTGKNVGLSVMNAKEKSV